MAFVNPGATVEHNMRLPMAYDRPRQFDVGVRSASGIAQLFEAKDYGGPIEIGVIESFETKLQELKHPPPEGGGVISSHGFQEGPVERTKFFGSKKMVRSLYQLRPTTEDDWEDTIKTMQLQMAAHSINSGTISLNVALGQEVTLGPRTWDRRTSFLRDSAGRIRGNLLDRVNAQMRQAAKQIDTSAGQGFALDPVHVKFEDDLHLCIDGRPVKVVEFVWTPATTVTQTSVSLDLSSGARDTLIDCLSGQRVVIPDPDKRLAASRNGFDLSLSFEPEDTADVSAMAVTPLGETASDPVVQLANAIQLRSLFKLLEHGRDECPVELRAALDDAGALLAAGHHAEAKARYWESCAIATSLVALVNLTYLAQLDRDLAHALRLADRAAKLFPLEVDGFVNLAWALGELGRFDEAHAVVRGARLLHAGSPKLLLREGHLFIQQQNWAAASQAFDELCAIDEEAAEPRFLLAWCESESGMPEEAAWDALRAFQLGERKPARILLILRMLRSGGWLKEAVEVGSTALAVLEVSSPTELASIRLETAVCALETGNLELTDSLIATGVPDEPKSWHLRGLLAYENGQIAEAEAWLAKFVGAEPRASYGLHNLAMVTAARGDFEQAYAMFRGAADLDPANVDVWRALALSAAQAGKQSDAVAATQEAAKRGADAATLLIEAADAANGSGQRAVGAALRMESLVHTDTTQNAATLFQLAAIRIEQATTGTAELALAQQVLAEAIGKDPGHALAPLLQLRLAFLMHDESSVDIWMAKVLEPDRGDAQAILLASAASHDGYDRAALRILERYRPKPAELSPGAPLPHPDAIRAGALLMSGAPLDEVEAAIRSVGGREHRMHLLVEAFFEYAREDCDASVRALDRLAGSAGGHQAELATLPLRLQCLMELGRHAEAGELVRTVLPGQPLAQSAWWWGANDAVPPSRDDRLAASLGPAATLQSRTDPEGVAEHALFFPSGGGVGVITVGVVYWDPYFIELSKQPQPPPVPVLVRWPGRYVQTVRRLRALMNGRVPRG